jgi:hypothetical protein
MNNTSGAPVSTASASGAAPVASPAIAGGPPDWRQSGSPSSPKVRWQPAPRLGWQEVWNYTRAGAEGWASGAAGVAAGLGELLTSPRRTLGPWLSHPGESARQAGQEAQRKAGEALRAAREGDFGPVGHLQGEQAGSAAAGAAVGQAGGALVAKAGQGVAVLRAARAERGLERLAQTPEVRAHRVALNHGADSPLDPVDAVLKRPVERLTETEARAEASRLERQARGHSLDRHGPQFGPADHLRRVTTGVAADGKFSPTKASTQFHDLEDWVMTREKAVRYAEAKYGLEAGRAPDRSRGQPDSYEVILEYDRAIDSGMVGTGARHAVPHPATGARRAMHTQAQPIDGVTRTKTTLAWDKAQQRWVVAQHMPWAEGWNNATKAYERSAVVHAKGVMLDTGGRSLQ